MHHIETHMTEEFEFEAVVACRAADLVSHGGAVCIQLYIIREGTQRHTCYSIEGVGSRDVAL